MRTTEELDKLWNAGQSIPVRPPALSTKPVACVERHSISTRALSIPAAIRLTYDWAMRWKPESYMFNLRPGLPLWLFWVWQRMGVPCTGVIAKGQLESTTAELSSLIYEAWSLCTDTLIVDSPDLRDDTCRANGNVITIEHIITKANPDN